MPTVIGLVKSITGSMQIALIPTVVLLLLAALTLVANRFPSKSERLRP